MVIICKNNRKNYEINTPLNEGIDTYGISLRSKACALLGRIFLTWKY